MGLFKSIFKKDGEEKKAFPKGFYGLKVSDLKKLTPDSIQLTFELSDEQKNLFRFVPGQYLNLSIELDGKEERRSYSICSGANEALSIAVKAVENGKVSRWANTKLQVGDVIPVSKPEGNFVLQDQDQHVLAFAAGSGITPIMSMAKAIQASGRKMHLFYGNKTEQDILFKAELDALDSLSCTYYLSREEKTGYEAGRLDKENISSMIKKDLSLLKADAFFLCGPEEMILAAKDVLHLFGVPAEKIHVELFSTPVNMPMEKKADSGNVFTGTSQLKVILDDEQISFKLDASGKTILDAVNDQGYDAPYSCRGAVCCTCRANVLSGKATMTLNYSLSDKEIEEGFILTCQAHPASEELTITYDE